MSFTSSTKRAAALIFLLLALAPWILPEFWTLNILARAFALGIVALSLTFLVSFCGMVSLCQMTIAGVAGYTLALFSPNAAGLGVTLTWPMAAICALCASTAFGAAVGWAADHLQ